MTQAINGGLVALNGVARVFWSYAANMFVQSTILIVLLLFVDLLLQKRVRAGMRYCLWMLVLLKLLLPPTLCLPTGVGYWIGDYMSADSPVLHQFSEAVQLRSVSRTSPEDFTATPETLHVRPPKPFAETLAPVASAASRVTTPTWQAVVFLVWLVGVLVISALLIQRIRFVRGLLAQSQTADGRLLDMLSQCRRQVGVRRHAKLKLSDNTPGPAVCGLFKPTILIPTAVVEELSPDRLRAVLIHELAHIKRGDLWVNCVQTVLQIIYFYNPFVWLANAVVRRIREQAVDEMVLVALGPEAKSYSNTLIDIAEMAFWRTNFSLRLIGVVESKKALKRRIKHMLARPIPKSAKIGVFGLLSVIVMAAVLLPMAVAITKEEKESEPRFTATLPNGVTVELVGVCEHPSKGNKWWRADGTMIEDDFRPYAFKELRSLRLPSNQQENKILELALNITDSSNRNVGMICSGANRTFVNCRNNVWGGTVEVGKEPGLKDFKIGVAAGAWETLASSGSKFGSRRRKTPGIVFTEAYNTQKGYAVVIVTHKKDIQKENWRVAAIDKEGELHKADLYQTQGIGEFEQNMFHFKGLKSDQIRRFEFQTRPYQWVTFTNVSLRPGVKANVQIEVEKPDVQVEGNALDTYADNPRAAISAIIKQLRSTKHVQSGKGTAHVLEVESRSSYQETSRAERIIDFRFKDNLSRSDAFTSEKGKRGDFKYGCAVGPMSSVCIIGRDTATVRAEPFRQFHRQLGYDFHPETFLRVLHISLERFLKCMVDKRHPDVTLEVGQDAKDLIHIVSQYKGTSSEEKLIISLINGVDGMRLVSWEFTSKDSRDDATEARRSKLQLDWKKYGPVWYISGAISEGAGVHDGLRSERKTTVTIREFIPSAEIEDKEFTLDDLNIRPGATVHDLILDTRYKYAGGKGDSAQKLRKLNTALQMYANDYEDKFPDTIEHTKQFLDANDLKWVSENVRYLGKGKSTNDDPDIPLAYDRTTLEQGKGTNVLFVSGIVSFRTHEQLENLGIKPVQPEVDAERIVLLKNLKQLALAVILYAHDHNGNCAENLEALKEYLRDEKLITWVLENVEYLGKGAKLTDAAPTKPMAYCKPLVATTDGTAVAFFDSHVEFVKRHRLEELGIKPKP